MQPLGALAAGLRELLGVRVEEVVRRGDRLFVLNLTGDPVTVHGTTVDGGGAVVLDVPPAVDQVAP